ncbi:MAG: hypothetical protein OEV92_13495, partial [Nitrospinota bacterium]|nr:hypothetical protein [Nitrospinota bacterium]
CSTFSGASMELGADPMVEHVREWTRSAKLYRQFDTTIIVDVTYNGKDLRNDVLEAKAKAQRLDADEKARLAQIDKEENEKYAQFYLAMYTPEAEWSEIAKKNPAWIVFMDTPEGPVFAEPAQKIMQDEIPWGASLPYDPRFRMFYKINIPRKGPAQGGMKLVLSSLVGEVYASWDRQ